MGLTGFAHMTDQFRAFCCESLRAHPNIHVLIYRTYALQTSVLSLDQHCAQQVHSMLTRFAADEFQIFYFVVPNRGEVARRGEARGTSQVKPPQSPPAEGLFELSVDAHPPKAYLTPQPLAYRFDLQERLPSGEPVFRYIPPYLPVA